MGCLTWLSSKRTKEYCDLGKLVFDDKFLRRMKRAAPAKLTAMIADYLVGNPDQMNHPLSRTEADAVAAKATAWIATHPDWRFLGEYDEAFDDIYLAEDDDDAKEYVAEFGSEASPIYKRTGTVW